MAIVYVTVSVFVICWNILETSTLPPVIRIGKFEYLAYKKAVFLIKNGVLELETEN